jgi:hypothetical protein
VFIVDQGADFELDADSTHPEIWAQTGLSEQALPFTPQDFRPAQTGPYVPARAASKGSGRHYARRVLLRVNTHKLWVGGQLRIRGHVRGGVPAGARVRVDFRTRGQRHWHRLRRKPVEANGRFATWPRLTRPAHVSRFGAPILRLRDRHLSAHARIVRFRAFVHGVGRSGVVRVRIRHRH